MNHKFGWKLLYISKERYEAEHPLRTKTCIGFCAKYQLYRGKFYWIWLPCEVIFKTRDHTKFYCSSNCRVGRFRKMKQDRKFVKLGID